MTNKATSKKDRRLDMSPEEIGRRVRDLGQLYKFRMSIRHVESVGKVRLLGKRPGSYTPDST
jgi:hypothetical protein